MKKIITLILAVVITATLCLTAYAAGETVTYTGNDATADGSLTVTGANPGETYTVYKVFNATYNGAGVAYTYTVSSTSDKLLTAMQARTDLFKVTLQNGTSYTYNIEKVQTASDSDFVNFFKTNSDKLSQLVSHKLSADKDSVTFEKIPYGYYYVTTTTGTMISIDTNRPNVSVEDKNAVPVIHKTAKEKDTGNFVDSNTASIGDVIDFKIVVTAGVGALNYRIEDTMNGFRDLTAPEVTANVGGKETKLTEGNEYTFTAKTSPVGFTLTFSNDFLATLDTDDTITVTYSATVEETAEVGTNANTNNAVLHYGSGNSSNSDKTVTKVWKFDLSKTDGTSALSGVVFRLFSDAEHKEELKFKNSENTYKLSKAQTASGEITTNGNTLSIEGLSAGTYYLYEESTVAGYNKLTEDVVVTIAKDGSVSYSYKDTVSDGTVTVVNNSGTALPSTGGVGTKLFIVFGSAFAVLAGIVLVTNKRMRKENL